MHARFCPRKPYALLHHAARLFAVVAAVGGLWSAAATPATRPAEDEEERLQRGTAIRKVLLNTLEQSYAENGVWPQQLPAPAGDDRPKLVYLRPDKLEGGPMADLFAGATPVLYEEMSDHTGGAWIGYADGHLEFAASPPEFAARGDAMPPLRDAVTRYGNPLVGSADPAVHRQPAAPAADAAKIK